MKTIQILLILALALGGVFLPVQSAFAAPVSQTSTPIAGTVTTVTVNTDTTTGVTTVIVGYTDSTTGATQMVTITLAAAVTLGLVTVDATTGAVTVAAGAVGSTVTIDPTMMVAPTAETFTQPVAEAIAKFFDLDYETVMGFHEAGNGFGVIVQACYMSFQLAGDASLCSDILEAKKSGDYSAFTLPDGSTASNWGQFKKALLEINNPHNNLGGIRSGHADKPGEISLSGKSKGSQHGKSDHFGDAGDQGNGHGNNGQGQDKDKEHGKGHNKP